VQVVRYRGGKAVGGTARLRFEKGETVRFAIVSDVDEEVHVHGYDVVKAVPAGKDDPVQLQGGPRRDLRGRDARQRRPGRPAAHRPVTAQRARRAAAATGAGALSLLVLAPSAGAHGLVGRADLPIPEEAFAAAAAVVLVLSFLALAAGWSESRLETPRERPSSGSRGPSTSCWGSSASRSSPWSSRPGSRVRTRPATTSRRRRSTSSSGSPSPSRRCCSATSSGC
jgi:hypothetical protein